MDKIVTKAKRGRFLSFILLTCMAFSFAAGFRYYIRQSIYAAFDLGNLGALGQKLHVSVLVALFAALGWAAGLITAFFTRKKRINTVTLYWVSGLFAVVALFFTPYNLQLLMPSTIMQNISMTACIAHIVFILVDMWMFGLTFCAGCSDVCRQSGKYGAVVVVAEAAIATVLAYLSIIFRWSFVVQTAVYGGSLAGINVLHAAFPEKDNDEVCGEYGVGGQSILCIAAAATLLFAAVLVGAYFITEKYIAIA